MKQQTSVSEDASLKEKVEATNDPENNCCTMRAPRARCKRTPGIDEDGVLNDSTQTLDDEIPVDKSLDERLQEMFSNFVTKDDLKDMRIQVLS